MSEISHFRFIFNPYDWSTVVNWTINISLIFALLISFILLKLSTEKLSWDDWHWLMKRIAEGAENIERQDSERGSEEVNRQYFSCMRRFPVLRILVTVVLGLWPAGNI